MNPLTNNDPIVRAIHLARTNNLTLNILFNVSTLPVSISQKNVVFAEVKKYCKLAPITEADIVVGYFPPYEICVNSFFEQFYEKAINATFVDGIEEKVSSTLSSGCNTLLKTAFEKLGYEQFDVPILMKIAKTAAYLAQSPVIRIEDLAEAIHYRSFDRSLIEEKVFSRGELQTFLEKEMLWQEEFAQNHFKDVYENLDATEQHEWDGIMWGWQDAVEKMRKKFGISPN